jgi:hypothetical protein
MRLSLTKATIIGVLLAVSSLLGGCGAFRLAYNNGSQLAWWWLDGYVDFSNEQSPRVKEAIDRWFDWHRSTQVGEFAPLLVTLQAQVIDNTTSSQVCRWQQQVRDLLEPGLERALQLAADQVPGLGEAQWRHMEKSFAKKNAEARRDFLQPRPEDRQKAAFKRALERAETLYGSLDEPQRKVIVAGVAASPFDPQAWLAQRERRQRETLQTLRRLGGERADRDRILAALRVLAEHVETSPEVDYRSYQQRLADYNCSFAAQVHNVTTPAQRSAARDRLKGWEDDARSLMAARNAPIAAAPQ